MKSDHGRWPFSFVRLDGPTYMLRFLKKSIYKAFGPLTGWKANVGQKNDHAPKSECVDFFNICLRKAILKNIQVWPFSCLLLASLVFTSLINVSKMWPATLFTICFTKKMSGLICTCSMWHVPCVVSRTYRRGSNTRTCPPHTILPPKKLVALNARHTR